MRRSLVLVLVVAGIASFWTADLGQTVGSRPLPRADKVLLVGIPRLGLGDVTPTKMPNLVRLGDRGAIGSLRVKTNGPRPNVAEAYATVGAGETTRTGATGTSVYGATDRYRGTTALEAQRLKTGEPLTGRVVIPSVPQMLIDGSDRIGTLPRLLAAEGHGVAVVSNADEVDASGRVKRMAPAALAVTDRNGVVKMGDTSSALVRHAPGAPFGMTVDRTRFVDRVLAQFRKADLVVADPGETLRSEDYLSLQTKQRAVATRRQALARTDQIIGDLVAKVPPDTRVIVFGVTPGAKQWALTPIVIGGAGVVPGRIGSPSTHRSGMATLTDLTPTVLTSLGVRVPDSVGGSALRENPGQVTWSYNRRFDRMFATHSTITRVMMVTSIVVQSALFLGALVFLGWGRPGRGLERFFEIGSLTFAAWPLATFLVRLSVLASSLSYGTIVVTWAVALAVALGVRRLVATPMQALEVIAAATFAVICVDLATGAHLLFGSFFGYTPDTSGRYFGINNSVFAILASCAVLIAAVAVERGRGPDPSAPPGEDVSPAGVDGAGDRRAVASSGIRVAATVFLLAVLVDGAPWMGADIGGILTLVPVLGLTFWALLGRKVRWPYVVGAAGAGVLALAVAVGIDIVRLPDQRSHLGRFFLGVGSGDDGTFTATIAEKWKANTAVLGQSLWAWVIPIVAVYALYVLLVAKGWRDRLPVGSPARVATVSGLAVGLVGWLLNDSGVVVTALVFVYLGPFLILVALQDMHRRGEHPVAPGRPTVEVS